MRVAQTQNVKSSAASPTSAIKAGAAKPAANAKTAAPAASPPAVAPKAPVGAQPPEASAAPKRKWRALPVFGGVLALALLAGGGAAAGAYSRWTQGETIAPNVQIAGEPVGGLTRAQARDQLQKRFGKVAFALQTGDKPVVLGLRDIGGLPSIEPTVAKAYAIGREGSAGQNFLRVFGTEAQARKFMLPVEWNRGALTARLKIVNQQYAIPAREARLVTVSGGAPRVESEATGRALDVSATADAIQKSYYLGLPQVAAVTRAVTPTVTAAALDGRDVKLGDFVTRYNGGIAGRTTNIHVACRALDGQVLMPGETLSFNGLTGERTYRKGYRMAHIFLREKGQTESQVVDGLAGGVCQVSSTLYNAVRATNKSSAGTPLRIVERSSHSLPVTYVAPGRDATVAWPSRDFKFRNAYDFPVYVRTQAGNGKLRISIWGRVPNNSALPVALEN